MAKQAKELWTKMGIEYDDFIRTTEPRHEKIVQKIFDYFISYKEKCPQSSLQLVLVGGINFDRLPFEHQDVIYTGFVSDEEKMVILQHAKIVINPSKFESLSRYYWKQ